MDYRVKPGLYAVGNPDKNSPVLISANYKLSFDALRKELSDIDAWILVIDTKGINVWCAAGEGTFGTAEIVKRINETRLGEIVSHKTIIVPQLGAPGVAAYKVKSLTGFKIVYGPVRASDIKRFLDSGLKADDSMRSVDFTLKDRLVLTPVEFVGSLNGIIIVYFLLLILNIISIPKFSLYNLFINTTVDFIPYFGSVIIGCIIVPILLPYIPGRAFSIKGWIFGILWTLFIIAIYGYYKIIELKTVLLLSYFLTLPAIASFLAINFTGCTTYTSPSGVKKELRLFLPAILISIFLGFISLLIYKIF